MITWHLRATCVMMHAMHLSSLVTMLESGLADRTLLDGTRRLTGADIGGLVRNGAVTAAGRSAVVYAGENHPELPIALLSAAWAGVPFVPVNDRLDDAQRTAWSIATRCGGVG